MLGRLGLSLLSCSVTLDKSLKLSGPQCPPLENRNNNSYPPISQLSVEKTLKSDRLGPEL